MNRKLYWGLGVLIILIIGVGAVLVIRHEKAIHKQLKADLDVVNKLLEEQNKPSEVPDEKGHVHDDGTFHVGEHDNPLVEQDEPTGEQDEPLKPPPSRDFEPVQIQIPEGITDPDVIAAWKRLDDISNNIWEWGGKPSPRAVELIDQLMPPPVLRDHGHGEEVEDLIHELIEQDDPRAAQTLIATMCEGSMVGVAMIDALVEIGPPAVPYILPYVSKDYVMSGIAIKVLGRIAEQYRDDLDGIVDHIIIPKFQMVAADEEFEHFDAYDVLKAREALVRLQK